MSVNGNGGVRTRASESYTQRRYRVKLTEQAREDFRNGEVIPCAICGLPLDLTPEAEGGPGKYDDRFTQADHIDAASDVVPADRSTILPVQLTHRKCNRWRSNASMEMVAWAIEQDHQSPWTSAEIRLPSGRTVTGARIHNRDGHLLAAPRPTQTVSNGNGSRVRLHGRKWTADMKVWSDE